MGVDDTIEQWMRQAETNGELRSNPYFGKPLDLEDGYADTPEEMRMADDLQLKVSMALERMRDAR